MFSFHITRECAATWLVRRRLQSLPERNERCKQSSDQLLEQPIPFWRDVCPSRPLRCRPPATEQGRRLMPNFLWAAIAAGALASTGILSAPAQARDYPFCIKGKSYAGPRGDCSFDTYQQCLATASGRLAWCDTNPYFVYPEPRVAYPRKPRRHY